MSNLQKKLDESCSQVQFLENELNRCEDRSVRLARTVDKLKYDGESRSGNKSQRPSQHQSINSHNPFPISSNKKDLRASTINGSSQSPMKGKKGPNINNQIFYSNMPNYYSKYQQSQS